MKIINKYKDFLLESKIELLLEAKIKYKDSFKKALYNIDSIVASRLLNLEYSDIDVNTNYIDVDFDKEDMVIFRPDDKVLKMARYIADGSYCDKYTAIEMKKAGYDIKNIYYPPPNFEVTLVKELKESEIEKYIANYEDGDRHHIKWIIDGEERECLIYKSGLKIISDDIRPSYIKIGRFANSIFNSLKDENITPKDIEDFITKYKSYIKLKNDIFKRFDIVKGEDIRKYYLENKYSTTGGSLGSSCMKYYECQSFLDIYCDNDSVSLIILRSKDDENLIVGRALLWDAKLQKNGDKIKFMDRIYVNDYSDIDIFIQYAIKNKFYYKANQDYSEYPLVFDRKVLGEVDSMIMVDIKRDSYYRYPYIDTLKYFDSSNRILKNFTNNDYSNDLVLTQTNGGDGSCSDCGGISIVGCSDCGSSGKVRCKYCYRGKIGCLKCNLSGVLECDVCDGYKTILCDSCDGEGCDVCEDVGNVKCYKCHGKGEFYCTDCKGLCEVNCSYCNGDYESECDECNGSGSVNCYNCT